MGPNKAIASPKEGVAGGKNFPVATQAGDTLDTSVSKHGGNIETADVGQGPARNGATSANCHVGKMWPANVGKAPARSDATSANCHVGEIETTDNGQGLDTTSANCHMGEMGPANVGKWPARNGGAT